MGRNRADLVRVIVDGQTLVVKSEAFGSAPGVPPAQGGWTRGPSPSSTTSTRGDARWGIPSPALREDVLADVWPEILAQP